MRSVTDTIGRSFASLLLIIAIFIAFPFMWLGLSRRNDSNVFILDQQMNDEQDSNSELASHGSVALLPVSRSVDVLQERIEKNLCSLLERDSVLLGIHPGFFVSPAKPDT